MRGDGAEWLRRLAQEHFPEAAQVLDIYHGAEKLAAGAQAEAGRLRLLQDGYAGGTEWVGQRAAAMPAGGDGAALGSLLNYLCANQDRLPYALRLRRGQSIGSGLVEGSIKQLLNQRLKQTGARWKVEHVESLVELGAFAGPEWQAFWERN